MTKFNTARAPLAPAVSSVSSVSAPTRVITIDDVSFTVPRTSLAGITAAAAPAPPMPTDDGEPWAAVLLPVGVRSDDGRAFVNIDGIDWRALPLPLSNQVETAPQHMGAVVCGRIDRIEKVGSLVVGYGVMAPTPEGDLAARLVAGGYLTGVSIDGVGGVSELYETEGAIFEDFTEATIAGATITGIPAFADARIALGADYPRPAGQDDDAELPDDAEPLDLLPLFASAGVVDSFRPPRAWFDNPNLDGPTPLTVTDDGEVFGHLALWGSCHRDTMNNSCLLPPRSATDYRQFRTGQVICDNGETLRVGVIVMGCGHAPVNPRLTPQEVLRHYEHGPGTIPFARLAAGEDDHGIWLHGATLPDVTPELVERFRALAPSGDWRHLSGNYELIATLAVPNPGYPIVASAGLIDGEPRALITGYAGNTPCDELSDLVSVVAKARGESELAALSRAINKARR